MAGSVAEVDLVCVEETYTNLSGYVDDTAVLLAGHFAGYSF